MGPVSQTPIGPPLVNTMKRTDVLFFFFILPIDKLTEMWYTKGLGFSAGRGRTPRTDFPHPKAIRNFSCASSDRTP